MDLLVAEGFMQIAETIEPIQVYRVFKAKKAIKEALADRIL